MKVLISQLTSAEPLNDQAAQPSLSEKGEALVGSRNAALPTPNILAETYWSLLTDGIINNSNSFLPIFNLFHQIQTNPNPYLNNRKHLC